MKQNRHEKIVELIDIYEIETQEELADKLREAGFNVTQATVSRDIRQLHLSKVPAGNGRHRSDRKRNTEGRTGRGRYTDGCWVKGFNKKIVRERDNDG